MAQNWHFWSIWARPCRLIQCPVGGSVGSCGARAVSRKTPIYFIYFNLFHKSHVICSVATKHGVGTWCSVRLWNGIRLPNRLSIFHKPHMIWKKNKSKFDLGQPSIGSGIVISCLSRHKTIEQGAPHSRFFCSHIAVDDEHL